MLLKVPKRVLKTDQDMKFDVGPKVRRWEDVNKTSDEETSPHFWLQAATNCYLARLWYFLFVHNEAKPRSMLEMTGKRKNCILARTTSQKNSD